MQRLLGGLLCLLCLYFAVTQTVQANDTDVLKPNVVLESGQVVRLRHERFGTFDIKVAPAPTVKDYFGRSYQFEHTIWYLKHDINSDKDFFPTMAWDGCHDYWENPSCKVVFRGIYVLFMDNLKFGLIVLPESGWKYAIPNKPN